jgi:hypothetical protein
MKTPRLVAAACAAALCAVPVIAEDLTIVYKTTGQGGASTATSYYSSERMRVADAQSETIVEYGPGRIVSIDHKKKEYSEVTLAELEAAMKAMSAKMEQANAQMKEQMASMPPEVRQKMEQMMGGAAASVTVKKGATRQVAGYDCQDYSVTMGQMMEMITCNSTAIAPPAPNVDPARFASAVGPMASMAGNPMFKGVADLAEKMKEIQGFALAEKSTFKMMGRSMESSKEATEVRKGPIPASAFDVATIAKGYKKVDNAVVKASKASK